jgi:hypothetical protein
MQVYNANAKAPMHIMEYNEWVQWRKLKGLSALP